MADEGNGGKVVISVDADTKEFTVKIDGMKSKLGEAGEHGSSAFESMMTGAIGLNQAIELGEKLLEAYKASLENMAKVESWDNQKTALVNLGATAGLTKGQMELLVESVVKASHGTMTTVEATNSAFKLMSQGFKADAIPAVIEFAKRMQEVKNIPMEQTIQSLGTALSGRKKDFEELGLHLRGVGDRAQLTTELLGQMDAQSKKLGDGYIDVAERMKKKSEETGMSFKKLWGAVSEGIAVSVFGDNVDKAAERLNFLKSQMDNIDKIQAKGGKEFLMMMGLGLTETDKVLKLDEARALINVEIAKLKGTISEETKKESAELDKQVEGLKGQKELPEILSRQLQAKIQLVKLAEIENEQYVKGKSTAAEHYNAQKQMLDREFEERKEKLSNEPMTTAQYKARMEGIERDYYGRLKGLRMTDVEAFEQEQLAKMQFLETTSLHTENAAQKHAQAEIQIEDRKHQETLQRLRMEHASTGQFKAMALKEEERYQKEIARIQVDNGKLSAQNVKMGWHSAMAGMQAEWGSWAKVTQKLGAQTHSVLSKGFIDMAKSHKFSMDQMLGNFVAMIGETLIQKGTADLLMSIFPPNPGGMAVAGAEIALGSALVGATSGAASDVGGGGFAGGGAPGVASGGSTAPSAASSQEMNKKSASIIINGDFLNSRETANHLADVLRQNSDITDYSITAQGKSFG